MFRRPPTRIELKMDNAKEFEEAKAEREASLQSPNKTADATPGPSSSFKSSTAAPARNKAQITANIQQRIGFRPQPIPQVSHLPSPSQ